MTVGLQPIDDQYPTGRGAGCVGVGVARFCVHFILHLYLFVISALTLISRCWDYCLKDA